MAAALQKKSSYCDPRLIRILQEQYKRYTKNPYPNLLIIFDENDIRVWYCLIGGLDAPFLHGEYIFKIVATNDFPHAPPTLECCTVNGVFQLNGAICISIGEFHTKDKAGKDGAGGWRAGLGMSGFAINVANGLICFEGLKSGIRIQIESNDLKEKLAISSRQYNKINHPHLYEMFEELITSDPDSEPVRNIVNARLKLEALRAQEAQKVQAAQEVQDAQESLKNMKL